jgi:N-acetylmuramoyl-L-alanine amidase
LKTEIIGLQGQRISKEQAAVRRISPDRAQVYGKIVERYAMLFDRPEVRLRFLNNMIAKQVIRQKKLQHALRHFGFIQRTRLYDLLLEVRFYRSIMEELSASAGAVPIHRSKYFRNIKIPLTARTGFFCYQFRHALYGAGVMVALLMAFGLYSFAGWSFDRVNNLLASIYRSDGPQVASKLTAGTGVLGPVLAGELEKQQKKPPEFKPVWFVGKKGNIESWSNRAKIRTEFETNNEPRRYYVIPRGSDSFSNELRSNIVGIVYHTSESHIDPFTPEYSESIQRSTQGLINFIRPRKLYHYLIDRIGDIYRIVRDDHSADHAGHSIWADSKYTYVGLNDSFIGVCFESTVKSGAGAEDILTEAQIKSGRELTDVLRSKYNIDDANCTTHGIVAVSKETGFIGRKQDWIRNFPFDVMGLTDKYKVPLPSVSEYGFTYDGEVLQKLDGKLWEGAIIAERQFKKRAEEVGIDPETLRLQLLERYKAQMAVMSGLYPSQVRSTSPSLIARPPSRKLVVRSYPKPRAGRGRR